MAPLHTFPLAFSRRRSLPGSGLRFLVPVVGIGLALMLASDARAYPTDPSAQEFTKIRRLKWQQDINEGNRRGRRIPEGAQWPMERIGLRMLDNASFDITAESAKDAQLQAGLEALLRKYRFRRYYVALLDITDPAQPRYAGVRESHGQTPGSTAKVLLGAGMMRALKQRFPKPEDRAAFLRQTVVAADDWAMPNHHEVPVIAAPIGEMPGDPKVYRSRIRSVKSGDKFTLWEWMDHALSPSSNASASMMWREATLLNLLGAEYPPVKLDREFWGTWDKETLTAAAFETVEKPLEEAGLNPEDFHIRMFFTRGAGKYIKSERSQASPLGMLRWMLRVEQGRMVDSWSSLELKKLLYLTRRRIRYIKTPSLDTSATFFKTGSLYRCKEEEGFACYAYVGNVLNVLNAFATIETPAVVPAPPVPEEPAVATAGEAEVPPVRSTAGAEKASKKASDKESESVASPALTYMVAVMSNELRRNAATDHGRLSAGIHQLILDYHKQAAATTP